MSDSVKIIDRDWLKFIDEQISIIYNAAKTILDQVGERGTCANTRIDKEFIKALANHLKLALSVLSLAQTMIDSRLQEK